jgi:hypothetical protein
MSLDTLRDLVIIVYGAAGILFFALLIGATLMLFGTIRELIRAVRNLIDDPLKPTINEVRSTLQELKGTTEFISDQAVHPIIRTAGVISGVKRGLSVASGIARRRR